MTPRGRLCFPRMNKGRVVFEHAAGVRATVAVDAISHTVHRTAVAFDDVPRGRSWRRSPPPGTFLAN